MISGPVFPAWMFGSLSTNFSLVEDREEAEEEDALDDPCGEPEED